MKIVAMLRWLAKFDINGNPKPARFAYDGKVIDVEQIV